MKLRQIVEAKPVIEKIINGKIPVTIGWNLKLLVEKSNPELLSFEQIKNQKVKEYGTEVKDEKDILVGYEVKEDSDNFKEYMKEIDELLDKEINLETNFISKNDFENLKDIKGNVLLLNFNEIKAIDWLIKEI